MLVHPVYAAVFVALACWMYGKIAKQRDVSTFHSFEIAVTSEVFNFHGEESLGHFQLLNSSWQLGWRVSMWGTDLLLRNYVVWSSTLSESRSWGLTVLFPWPGKSPCPPLKERKVQKLQESPNFSAQLGNPLLPAKRGMQKPKASSAGTILSLPFTETHQASVKSL